MALWLFLYGPSLLLCSVSEVELAPTLGPDEQTFAKEPFASRAEKFLFKAFHVCFRCHFHTSAIIIPIYVDTAFMMAGALWLKMRKTKNADAKKDVS